MKTSSPFLVLGALALGLSALGCEERVKQAPATKSVAGTPGPGATTAPGQPGQARASLGTIREAGKTFRPTQSVIVWDETKQELSFYLYPFTPSAPEIEQVRRGSSFISFNKPSPDTRQWPEHCPSATYVLSWARKPKEAIGDLAQARYLLHLHGISQKNANMSINRLSVEGDLRGKIASGEQIRLAVKDRWDSAENPIEWDLVLEGQVQVPPPPPEAPQLSPEQKGKLGVVTFGDLIYKVEGALAKRDPKEQLARIALLPRAPTPEDAAAYRAGDLSQQLEGYVEVYLFCRQDGFGSPPQTSQRKLILKSLTGPLQTTSFFMTKAEFSLSGSLEAGQTCGLKAKGLEVSTFSSSLGKIASWDLNLEGLEVLEAKSD
tara:strand:+ start:641 stop:1771 length:1131 start_codon:yes stop_codon:yes gene_type:complete